MRVVAGLPSIVFLRVQDAAKQCIPLIIGDSESQALAQAMRRQSPLASPPTHDVAQDLIAATGYRVTRVHITHVSITASLARIHLALPGGPESDVDARPGDAINLALRFGAPMYVCKRVVAETAATAATAATASLSHPDLVGPERLGDIRRSVRQALVTCRDPALLDGLRQEVAAAEQRFGDALAWRRDVVGKRACSATLRVAVAMEAALEGGRLQEAAGLRNRLAVMEAEERRAGVYAAFESA